MSKHLTARTQMKALLDAIPAFASKGVVATLEHSTAGDIEPAMEQSLEQKGIAVTVLTPTGAAADQKTGSAFLSSTIPVVILENRAVNLSDSGVGVASEELVETVIRAIIGKPVGDGYASLSPAAFARIEDDDGLITNVIMFSVPVVLRAS